MPLQILYIDDSVTMQRAMQITFSREDARVICASDGNGAQARVRETRPDVIVIDVQLGQSDGYNVCRELKELPDLAQVPVLLLANKQNPIDEARAEACGAKGHGIKPFDTQTMVDRVRALANLPPTATAAPRTPRPIAQAPAQQAAREPAQPRAAQPAAPPPPETRPAPAPQPAAFTPAPATLPPAPQPVPASMTPPPPQPAQPTHVAAQPYPAVQQPPPRPAQPPPAAPQPRHTATQPTASWSVTPVPAPSAPPSAARAPVARPPVMAGAPPAAFHAPPAAAPPRAAPPGAAGMARTASQVAAHSVGQALHKAGVPVDQAALMSMAREIIERVAWEVIPELAETMIREQLDRQQKL